MEIILYRLLYQSVEQSYDLFTEAEWIIALFYQYGALNSNLIY